MEHHKRMVLMMGFMASMVIVLQTLRIPSRNDFSHQLPTSEIPKSITWVGKSSLLSDTMNLTNRLVVNKGLEISERSVESEINFGVKEMNEIGLSALTLKQVQVHSLDLGMPKTNFSSLAKNESLAIYSNGETSKIASVMKKKKKLRALPPVYISDMNRLLVRNRAAYHAMVCATLVL